MVKLWVVTSILATWAVVVKSTHHYNVPSPAPAVDCSVVIYDMADCISFLSNGSNETKPVDTCCSGFESVLKTDPYCICEAIKTSAQMGIAFNITKADTLPSACGVSAPPVSNCDVSMAPGAPPANPPKSPPKSAPSPKHSAPVPPKSAPSPKSPKHSAPVPPKSAPSPKSPTPPAPVPPTSAPSPKPIAPVPPTAKAPAPSTIIGGGVVDQVSAPSPAASGAYSTSTSIVVLIIMLVASFSCISA